MIALVLFCMAAICNAAMDRMDVGTFEASIFRNWNKKFWYKPVSAKYARMIGGWRLDAWHCAKSTMLFLIVAAIIFYRPVVDWYVDYPAMGMGWIVVFNTFYNHVFKAKRFVTL